MAAFHFLSPRRLLAASGEPFGAHAAGQIVALQGKCDTGDQRVDVGGCIDGQAQFCYTYW
jgi:hypothetical protein